MENLETTFQETECIPSEYRERERERERRENES
jgi:hypothetical protein